MHRSVVMPAKPISIDISCAVFVRDYGQMIRELRYRYKFCRSSDLLSPKMGMTLICHPPLGSTSQICVQTGQCEDEIGACRFHPGQDRTSQGPPLLHRELWQELCKLHVARKVKPNFIAEHLHLIFIYLLSDRYFPLSFKNESFLQEEILTLQWTQ